MKGEANIKILVGALVTVALAALIIHIGRTGLETVLTEQIRKTIN